MIRRPNVRARLYRLNVQAAHRANYRYGRRVRGRYFRSCNWCHRPCTASHDRYPRLCESCGWYLLDLESDHFIPTNSGPLEGYRINDKRILQVIEQR